VVYGHEKGGNEDFVSERDILYKILFQLRAEMDEMKKKVQSFEEHAPLPVPGQGKILARPGNEPLSEEEEITEGEILPLDVVEEGSDLSLNSLEKELIIKVLQKNKGHRKSTARELGIAERTLYRKIKEYEIE
jgi:DNA-binding NtrC family response regulator